MEERALADLVLLDGPLPLAEWAAQQGPDVGLLWAAYWDAVRATARATAAYYQAPTPRSAQVLADARREQANVDAVTAPMFKLYSWYDAGYPRKWLMRKPALLDLEDS